MKGRPRLLYLAYYFPPAHTVGCVRAYNTAKWLTRRGWEVTVVTPGQSVWRRTQALEEIEQAIAKEGIRCIRTDHRWAFLSPDQLQSRDDFLGRLAGGVGRKVSRFLGVERERGWMAEAARACAGLEPEDVDVVLASGPPFSSFELARDLAKNLRAPFVLDYRDLWSSNPYAARPLPPATVRLERELLSSAAAVTVVSPGLAASLASRFGLDGKLGIVTNGFDVEEMSLVRPESFGHFAIVYAGQFYPPKSRVDPIMALLRRLKEGGGSDTPWMFHYYGLHEAHVLEGARRFGVEDRVVSHGNVSRAKSLAAVRGAGISIVVVSASDEAGPEDRGVVTGKVYEAIGLGTPLLAFAPAGSDLEGVLETAGLGRRFSPTDDEQAVRFVRSVMSGASPRPNRPEAYAWPALAQRMEAVLTAALDGRRS
jgi:hypothetical protein